MTEFLQRLRDGSDFASSMIGEDVTSVGISSLSSGARNCIAEANRGAALCQETPGAREYDDSIPRPYHAMFYAVEATSVLGALAPSPHEGALREFGRRSALLVSYQ
jgi:hypothetical protein